MDETDPKPPSPFLRAASFAALGVFLAVVGAGVWLVWNDPGVATRFTQNLKGSGAAFLDKFYSEVLKNPWFYGVFAAVLLLEHLVPAQPGQKLVSRGLRHDAIWIGLKMLAHATLLPIYLLFLGALYERHLSFLTIHSVEQWPWLAKVLLALIVVDLLFWATHVVRHHVPALWYFHAVHHSQKELNFFTEYRVHPIDDLFVFTIGVIPLFMVQQGFETILAVVWIRHWHTRIYHSNIRTNFGFLRYLLVTPQSHRVHHSIEPRHHDRNFGLTFSLWDHLFGTQYRGYDEYPETGINDLDFPFEQERHRFGELGTFFGQLLYPFRALGRI